MNKIRITTNKGKVFDWFLNHYLNFILWLNGIDDDKDIAVEISAREINKIKRFMNW